MADKLIVREDPEVSTLSTLTNVQNSLFVPQLGNRVNRRATYRLLESPEEEDRIDRIKESLKQMQSSALEKIKILKSPQALKRSNSITSQLKDSRYAVLPHGVTLDGWSYDDKEELDDMVRHMLHSRRSRFKRSMRGFGQYVKRRKPPVSLYLTSALTIVRSAWIIYHDLRHLNHPIRSRMGIFLDRMDITWFETRLYHQCRRQRPGGPFRNHR